MANTYTVKEVARILGYSTNSIYTFLKEKRIKGVRVGKGRYRVPKSEVDRLLSQNKSSATASSDVHTSSESEITGVVEPRAYDIEDVLTGQTIASGVSVPGLMDWFIGMGAIVVGFSMYLFSSQFDEFSLGVFTPWLMPLRTTLIAAGIGLLVTDITHRSKTVWRVLFFGILGISFGLFAVLLAFGSDLLGAAFFGMMIPVMGVHIMFGLGSIASIGFMLTGFLSLLPAVAYISRDTLPSSLYEILSTVNLSFLVAVWGVCVLGYIVTVVWSYLKHRRMYWILVTAGAGVCIGISLWQALLLSWGKSMLILLLALIALFSPTWETLEFRFKSDRKFAFGIFGTVILLFLSAIGVVRIMQTNMMDYAKSQLESKAMFGKILIENELTSAKSIIESASTNDAVSGGVLALTEEDDTVLAQKALDGVIRGLFEGTGGFQQILVTSTNGDVISSYPLEAGAESESVSFRSYFQNALSTRETVLADISDAGISRSARSLVIARAIESDEALVGVLIGVFDITRLGNQVQQIASPLTEEYFIVSSDQDEIIIHPDSDYIESLVEEDSPMRDAKDGFVSARQLLALDKKRVLAAADKIEDTDWRVGIYVPLARVVSVTGAAGFVVFALVVFNIIVVVIFGVLRRHHSLRSGGNSP